MRTDSSTALLNEIIRLGLVTCTKCENDQWVPVTDRTTLYAALINTLIADADREGVNVVDGCYDKIEAIRCVEADAEEDEAAGIIYDGTPVDLDTHEFTDDCGRV